MKPDPNQEIEYVAIKDQHVIDLCIINTSNTNYPAESAKRILSGALASGAELYVRVGTKQKETN